MYRRVLVCVMVTVFGLASGKPADKTHSVGINGGILQPIDGYRDAGMHYHLGLLYWYETEHLVAELSAYGVGTYDVREICFPEVSLLYMLSKKSISPYFGGGIGFGYLDIVLQHLFWNVVSEGAIGVILNAGGGVVFFRTYDMRIILDARYRVNFADISGVAGPHHGLKLSVGFNYRFKSRGCCGIAF